MTNSSRNHPEKTAGTDKSPESPARKALLRRLRALSPDKRKILELRLNGTPQASQDAPKICSTPDSLAPLSFTQKRLWFLDQLNPGSTQYNQAHLWRLEGPLSPQALEQSLQLITSRHRVLGMRVRKKNEELYQDTATEKQITLDLINNEHLAADQREQTCKQQIVAAIKTPFDLSAGSLFRAQLYRLGENHHILLLELHHIVSDGWSYNLLKKELALAYNALSQGNPPLLPELPVQYGDYSRYQKAWFCGACKEDLTSYWCKQLSGNIEPHGLPVDFPRPPVQSDRGAKHRVDINPETTKGIKTFGKQAGATPFMVLTAVLNILISRYSGNEDIIIGTAIANRTLKEVEHLLGFFANTLVLRTDLSGNPDFREVTKRVRSMALGAYAHQDMPFEELVAELNPERDPSRTPLFQISLVFQNTPESLLELHELKVSKLEIENNTSKFDLTLNLREHEGCLTGYWEYCSELFKPSSIERMAQHFQVLLDQALANPELPVNKIPLLTPVEQCRFLTEWNDTKKTYQDTRCVHQLFESQVTDTPDAIALTDGKQQLTYSELNARANQLAHYLRGMGTGPGILVGLCSRRSLDMVIAVLGILKSGAAYVPIDPAYPQERIQYILQEITTANEQAPLLLTQQPLLEHLAFYQGKVICLDRDWKEITARPDSNPPAVSRPEHTAYVLYTSGSTGLPKGVDVPHSGLHHYLSWARGFFLPGNTVTAPLFTSVSFDLTITCLFTPLLSGGRLVVYEEQDRDDTLTVLDVVNDNQVNLIKLTPSHLALLSTMDLRKSSLKVIITGGEELKTDLANRTMKAFGDQVTLFNSYGPTETTVNCMNHRFDASEDIRESVPIGRPIANSRIYILDRNLQPVAIGVTGEIHIGGGGLAHGYLNKPDLTAEKFIPNLFSDKPGSRLYKTGDLARYLPDGKIEFIGRIDHQIKLRGYRIEPGEIEAALLSHSQVTQALVCASKEQSDDVRLLAYLVLDKGEAPQNAEWRTLLAKKLPDYMIPADFITIEAFPLTTNGKIDISALPVPRRSRAELAQTRTAPRTPIEESLADIWLTVLNTERIGIHDNFFELGGHSLLAARIISLTNEKFDVDVSLRSLFETPTIEGLATTVTQLKGTTRPHQNNLQISRNPDPLAPLSFTQKRLWFLDLLNPGSTQYNTSSVWQLDGPLDPDFLEQSLQLIASRHQVLNMRIREQDGVLYQDTETSNPVTLDLINYEHIPAGQREQTCKQQIIAATKNPFDLTTGPLFRTQLSRLAENHHILLLELHHIVSDGWSHNLLKKELALAYNALSQGNPPLLPELPVQYGDYSRYQQAHFSDEYLETLAVYWREQLSGNIEPHGLPVDFPRPPVQSDHGAKHRVDINPETTKGIKAFGKQAGATLFMVLTAALNILISRYSGNEDIIIGTAIANRTLKEVEPLIGFFANTLVLRTDLSGNPDFREVTKRVRSMALAAYAHQDMPFEELVAELNPERDPSRTPLFQISLVFQNTPESLLELDELEVSKLEIENNTSKFDLTLNLREHEGRITGYWEYCSELFKASTIERMARHFEVLLEHALVNPELPISKIPLLTPIEQHRLLAEWNDTDKTYRDTRCVHHIFQTQVTNTPDAVALTNGEQHLTYSELNARANQLAHYLQARGVGPEVMVAICVERSIEMVVGLLGILKAGGAYVPLAPDYPLTRLKFMLEDTGAPLLLTQTSLRANIPAFKGEVIQLDTDWPIIECENGDNPVSATTPSSLMYVIYTSGSTGRPKGVCVEHHSAVRLVKNTNYVELGPDEVFLQFAPISFDASTFELWGSLLNGAKLVIFPAEWSSLEELGQIIEDKGITTLWLTSALFSQMVDQQLHSLAGVRQLLAGGETLSVPHVQKMLAQLGNHRLINGYGPTENTTFTCCHVMTADSLVEESVPIGRPISNTTVRILDAQRNPVPIGVPGELYTGGDGVARGYLNRPELTADKFIDDPFSDKPGSRLYKTGDLARYLPDGKIEFIGRIDHQIKLRGYRIEPGEIEAALLSHPQVTQALVCASEEQSDDVRLLAYLVLENGEAPQNAEWRAWLVKKLPDYMIPADFITLEAFPLTTNGKIDISALPVPRRSRAELTQTRTAPRTPIEESLTDIWLTVLNTERIGIHDNFFELGGHSLLAARIISLTNEKFDADVSLRCLFDSPTIEGLAMTVTQQLIALTGYDETEFLMDPNDET